MLTTAPIQVVFLLLDLPKLMSPPTPILEREEYIEQAHFFRTFRERLADNIPSQEILITVVEEVLATTKLPMAIEFLSQDVKINGRMSDGMAHLKHYFTPFQTFVTAHAEQEYSQFDQFLALEILEKEAQFRSRNPSPAGLFFYQFECIARNRLGYDEGMAAMAQDEFYDDEWRDWIVKTRLQLGTVELADLIYFRSEHALEERRRETRNPDYQAAGRLFFGIREGRIAKANRGKDPLYMFAALQRQLGYPAVPRRKPKSEGFEIHPVLDQRLQRLEQTLKVLQMEIKGNIELSEFYEQSHESAPSDSTDQSAS